MKNGNYMAFDDACFIQIYNTLTLSGNILSDKYNSREKNTMNGYFDGFTEDYELTCGDKEFTVRKFIVYQFEIE